MDEPLARVLAWAAGLAIGGMFVGGLAWTLPRGLASPRPVLWFLGSLMVRTGLALSGFYFVSDGHWQRMLLCLLGFAVARFVITRLAPAALLTPPEERSEVDLVP